MTTTKGFTLIELMIVVVIIGVLAMLALPTYQDFVKKSRNRACLFEVKAYANATLYALNDQDDDTKPNVPTLGACASITDASSWTTSNRQDKITAIAKPPSSAIIECDLAAGMACAIVH